MSKTKTDISPALYDVIRRPVITEKSTMASEQNKVMFAVQETANKSIIKEAIEAIFNVQVKAVNTLNRKGKTKRFRGRPGKQNDVKHAVVTLAEGQTIDMSAGIK